MSAGGSVSKSSSNSDQRIWDKQAPILASMYNQAQGVYDQANAATNAALPAANQWASDVQDNAMGSWQNQLDGGAYSGINAAGALTNSLDNAMGGPTQQQQALNNAGVNNYADSYRQNFVNDANTATNSMLSNLDSRAAASGMSGGSRHGTATGAGMRDINQNLQSNLANVGYQDYSNNLNRQMQAGAAADSNLLSQQGMLGGLLSGQQGAQEGALAQSGAMGTLGQQQLANAGAGINTYGQMMNAIGAPTVLSKTKSESSTRSANGGI